MLYDKKWDKELPVDNFLSAEALNMIEDDRKTLIKLLGMFSRGEIPGRLFNMRKIGEPKCGTPGCLIGWAKTIDADFGRKIEETGLYWTIWGKGTPEHAAIALHNFLTTSNHKWQEVLRAV